MAATERLIERMGGGGTVGLAVAAVALAPTVLPPLRRGLRGLAKAVIVQYLRITETQPADPTPAAAPARRSRRGSASSNGNAAAAPAAAAPQPRARRGRPAATPEPAAAAPSARAPRQPRGQAATAAAEPAPARAPRRPRAQAAAATAESAPPRAGRPRQPRAEATEETARPAPRTTAAQAALPPAETQPAPRQGRAAAGTDGRINLNTATRGELSRLPRVGVQTADRIIEFREQNGPIRNIRQLRQAEIIPVSAAKGMKDRVRF